MEGMKDKRGLVIYFDTLLNFEMNTNCEHISIQKMHLANL